MEITRSTKLKDVIRTPAGHDIIARVLYSIGLDENLLNGLLGNITIRSLKTISFGKLDDSFIDALLILLNSQNEVIMEDECEIQHTWWKEAVFYEIYPRSFNDTNHDGIGDIPGIIDKLDYLKELGVNALWIGPFYDSPNADNGYDIRDYKKVMKEFGTMEDVERLFDEVHQRDMKIIIDLVMNHTSDEHEFFRRSLAGEEKYKDYYIWRQQETIPNNWQSLFSGNAWTYYSQRKSWALHLFAEKQIDLNWDNPDVRNEMYEIANWWLDKGADGFRLDVVSFISKTAGLPDGNGVLGKLVSFTGIEHYFHGPHLDEYLREFNEKCLRGHDAYTVGECPGNGLKMSRMITGDDRGELSQLFSFDHLENPGKARFDIYDLDLRKMIPELVRWQTQYSNHCWPSLFFENHDNPRMQCKVTGKPEYQPYVSKLLGALLFTLKGTPYLYQGMEIGMTNYPFRSLKDYRDIESLQMYETLIQQGYTEDKALARLLAGSRDHARTPMCWDRSLYAGFSDVSPWIKVNPDHEKINVETELEDIDSVLNHYRKLISMRKAHPAFVYGTFRQLKTSSNLFVFERKDAQESYRIVMNLTASPQVYKTTGELVYSSYAQRTEVLQPYQVDIYKMI